MEVRIELFTLRIEPRDAVLLQRLVQRLLGDLDAFDQRLQTGIGGFTRFRRHGIQRALQVVGDVEHVPRERGNAVGARVRDFLRGALAQVFHLRQCAERPVLGLGDFLGERLNRSFFRIVRHHIRL